MTPEIQQMPRDTTAPEAQTTPTAPVGQPPITPPAATGQGWNWFLRILGIVLAFGGGITLWYAIFTADVAGHEGIPPSNWLVLVGLVGFAVWAALAAALLRSWWSVLVVPAAFYVGTILAGNSFDISQLFSRGGISWGVLLLTVLPAAIGAVIGTPIGTWIEQRIRR